MYLLYVLIAVTTYKPIWKLKQLRRRCQAHS